VWNTISLDTRQQVDEMTGRDVERMQDATVLEWIGIAL
jgi:hypothetical protein